MSSREGLLFIISAPAGTGKTTLVTMLTNEFPNVVASISTTTRPIRSGETEGKSYHFVSDEKFDQKLSEGDFLEWAEVFGNRYGTSKSLTSSQLEAGKHVFLVIDTQGAMQVMKKISVTSIFVSPPSLKELRRRLLERRTEAPEIIEKRLAWAEKEMVMRDNYDYNIVNDDLETAYEALKEIVRAAEHRKTDD